MWDLEGFYFRAGIVRSWCSFYTDWGDNGMSKRGGVHFWILY